MYQNINLKISKDKINGEIAKEPCYNKSDKSNIENKIDKNVLPLTITVSEIAKALSISKKNAYDLCHQKGFPCIIVGKRYVISRIAFEKWLENPFIFLKEDISNEKTC